jgi:hypothetical protein
VLYLNPEWDYVRLFSKRPTGVLEFLHDMRCHDPRGVGALNLVIGRGTLKDLTNGECAVLKGEISLFPYASLCVGTYNVLPPY